MQYNEDKLIKKINELYINFRQHFTVLTKEGKYLSSKAMKGEPKLTDPWVKNHLKEKHTLVVFSGKEVSKFLCFDIDVKDKSIAKWVTYKIINRLIILGFNKSDIHVATSGNKGYHLFLFVQNGTSIDNFKMIYDIVLKEEELYKFEHGQVEYRPTNTQGVKIELSRNFKNSTNDNMCWFVDTDSLEAIPKKEHILSINPIPKVEFLNVLELIKEEHTEEVDVKQEMSLIEKLQEPHSHKLHKQENETIERAMELLTTGLTMSGTRHNSILLLAKYFRYMGLEVDECINHLTEWMNKQNKKFYSSAIDQALSEVVRVSNIVYDKGYTLTTQYEQIKIYKSEMEKISEIRNENLRLIMYSMLIHSKRYAMQNGVFYMSYKQIGEMVGLSCEKNILKAVDKLIESGYVTVIERNVLQKNSIKKKPNKYIVNLSFEVNEEYYSLDYDNSNLNLNDIHNQTILQLVTLDKLKVNLPKKQYLELRKLYNVS